MSVILAAILAAIMIWIGIQWYSTKPAPEQAKLSKSDHQNANQFHDDSTQKFDTPDHSDTLDEETPETQSQEASPPAAQTPQSEPTRKHPDHRQQIQPAPVSANAIQHHLKPTLSRLGQQYKTAPDITPINPRQDDTASINTIPTL